MSIGIVCIYRIMYLPYEFNIFQLETAPPLRDQIIIDRATQNSVQNRFDNLKKEASDIEVRNQQLKDALDNVIRLQARSEKVFLFTFFQSMYKRRFKAIEQIFLSSMGGKYKDLCKSIYYIT